MGYPLSVHESAFEMFRQGVSLPDIAQTLRRGTPGCERLTTKRLEIWRAAENWVARRKEILKGVQERLDDLRGDFMVEAIAACAEVRKRLVEECTTQTAKSLEGAVNALISVTKLERSLRGLDQRSEPTRIARAEVVVIADKFLQVIERHPVFKPLIERHRGELGKLFETEVLGPPKAVNG